MATYEWIVPTGVIVPDTSTLQDDVIAEYRAVFGADLAVTPDTPQGVLITVETLGRDFVARNNAALANQINPDLAGGVFLDAIWALTAGARIAATRSLVTEVTVTGVPGTIIPEGAQASVGAAGAVFETTSAVLLPSGGSTTVTFQAVDTGPIAAGVGALNTIVSGVLGWETVTNATAASLGKDEESDAAARSRRRNTLALQSVGLAEAIVSGLYTVDGVRSVFFRENYTDAPITVKGVNLVAHSIYAAVSGGSDSDIAAELLRRKGMGANWNGATTVNVVEPFSGQTYAVKFQRPDIIPIYAEVTVKQGTATGDPVTLVRDALVAYAEGDQLDEPGLVIGADVSAWELAGAVNRGAPGLYVVSVGIATTPGGPYASTAISIDGDEQAQLLAGSISVVVV